MPIRSPFGAHRLPCRLALSDALVPLDRAARAVGALQARFDSCAFRHAMIRAEGVLDAIALAGPSDKDGALLRLLVADASRERAPPRDLRPAIQMLDAARHGLARVAAGGRAALTVGLLHEMHQMLETGALPVARSPADPTPPLLHDLGRFLVSPPVLPLSVRMAIVAAQVEMLDLFGTAGAQLALLLVPLMSVAEGGPPLFLGPTLTAPNPTRRAALAAIRDEDRWEDWICRFLDRMAGAADAATARLLRVDLLSRSGQARLATLRSDSAARRLLTEALPGVAVVTVGAAQEMLGVSFQTANVAVATLVTLGMLRPHSSSRRNRMFVSAETLSILEADLDEAAAQEAQGW